MSKAKATALGHAADGEQARGIARGKDCDARHASRPRKADSQRMCSGSGRVGFSVGRRWGGGCQTAIGRWPCLPVARTCWRVGDSIMQATTGA